MTRSAPSTSCCRMPSCRSKCVGRSGRWWRSRISGASVRSWGATVRKVVSRLHRAAPSLVGHPIDVVQTRLKEEEDEILKQLHTLHERLEAWQQAD